MNEGVLRVLTVRQPWAGAIAHLGKDIENRPQRWAYRGPVLIHAAQHEATDEVYDQLAAMMGWPESHLLGERWTRGKIIAITEVVDCVELDTPDDGPALMSVPGRQRRYPVSLWFSGPYGYVLRNTQPLMPTPYTGGLGLRKFRFDEQSSWSGWHDQLDVALQEMGYTSRNVRDGDGLVWEWAREVA
jgi:hypothetical protein